MLLDDYILYIRNIRRYSSRTISIYGDVLREYIRYSADSQEDNHIIASLNLTSIRNYEVHLIHESEYDFRTVNLHLSVLSSFSKYLINRGLLASNPVRLIIRPKVKKRLPRFYSIEAIEKYFSATDHAVLPENLELQQGSAGNGIYERRLRRMIVSLLYHTGMRRSELIGLSIDSVNVERKVMRVLGKGDKFREIPISSSLCNEILLYLQSANLLVGRDRKGGEPLLITPNGRGLYPVYVDKVVKMELGEIPEFTGKKSPHVLRHTIATELLDFGADLNSIKELLGHSSLAATQVYTHNSIEKLKNVYKNAHPRAKIGGKNGD